MQVTPDYIYILNVCLPLFHSFFPVQKLLQKGHTQMEVDSAHAVIERKQKQVEMEVPADYCRLIREARSIPVHMCARRVWFFFWTLTPTPCLTRLDQGLSVEIRVWRMCDSTCMALMAQFYSSCHIVTRRHLCLNCSKKEKVLQWALPSTATVSCTAAHPCSQIQRFAESQKGHPPKQPSFLWQLALCLN